MAENVDQHLPAIAAGDSDAFGHWVAGVEAPLRASLHGVAARVDTESVLQETLLRVWNVAPRFRPDGRPDGLLRLAHRIARNLVIDELRRHRLHPQEIEELDRALIRAGQTVSPVEPDPLLRRIIERCRAELPRRSSQALQARLESGGGESDAELARTLGMRPNTFLQNITRARRALRVCLEGRGVDLEAIVS